MLNIAVDEFHLRIESDIAIQYALHTIGFRKQPFSRRSVLKSKSEINGSSLQSPKAPDATARTKAGKMHVGYVANVTETYDDEGNSLIIGADIQKKTHSDDDFMRSIIEGEGHP